MAKCIVPLPGIRYPNLTRLNQKANVCCDMCMEDFRIKVDIFFFVNIGSSTCLFSNLRSIRFVAHS